MRRFLSIVAIAALIASTASPLLAAACPHEEEVRACHQDGAAHAAATHHGHHMVERAAPSPGAAIRAVETARNCPMECCVAGKVTRAAAVTGVVSHPQLAVADQKRGYIPAAFAPAGLPSHTDRGPPSA